VALSRPLMQDSKKRAIIEKEKGNEQPQKKRAKLSATTPLSIFDQCFDSKTHPTWTEQEAREKVPLALKPIIPHGRCRRWNNILRYAYIIHQISNKNHRLKPRSHIINNAAIEAFVDLDCQWHFVTEQTEKRKEEKPDLEDDHEPDHEPDHEQKKEKEQEKEQELEKKDRLKKTWIIMTWKSESDQYVKAFFQGKKSLAVEYYRNNETYIPLSIRGPEFLMFWNYSHEFMPMPGQELEIVKKSLLKASHHRIAVWKTV
jgi:hypothetical protein